MTHLEAIEAVEARLTEMGLVDCFGDPIIGIEAVGILAKFHGAVWDEVTNHFEQGRIDPDMYASTMGVLIEEYNCYRHRNSIEKLLVQLRNEQGGAA